MTERPILFNGLMVRALLDGRKSQTRRLETNKQAAHIQPGDTLWVRETWTARMDGGWTIAEARSMMHQTEILYRADGNESIDGWWPSIHMPREFSRITLPVISVRVEPLRDISEADARAEGCPENVADAIGWYADLWNEINPDHQWHSNPMVRVIEWSPLEGDRG